MKILKVNSKEPLTIHTVLCRQFKMVEVDIMDFDNVSNLILVDCYSEWIDVCELLN